MTAQPWEERAARVQGLVLDVDGVLTDGRLYYGPDGESLKSFHVRDGLGLALLREAGIRLAILSGRESKAVIHRAQELRVSRCLLGRLDKAAALGELAAEWALPFHQLAAVGDDIVDVPMLRRVGVSFAPANAHPAVRGCVDVILRASGGRGAVREACEILLRATRHWPALERRFELQATGDERDGA